ncbi:MAG: 16S rRNA (adenine(1518)-N(6)/adenine(1519)-N(6))-dimethyltransferase RsmA [Candidatus Thermoplasmatota archaeon]|nr:16S rRNA (adenine(1518)-N(6)/adenine(1519)-N(6))-dimethyltransferase RsmA [Candidatus Thermoplasmatota archaeon]
MKIKLGQNFLIDPNIAQLEINYADVKKDDIVLEVGPGKGILTNLLAKNVEKVIAVEIDKNIIESLKETLPSNVTLIHSDDLKLDFKNLPKFNKIVSNLPYQISSPFTFKLLDYSFDLAVLIYQKEFAERIVAKPGSKKYSRLSVNVYYKSECSLLRIVSKNVFYPMPKVDSAIVKLIPRKTPAFYVENEKFFKDFVNVMFSHRRKKIKNIIKNTYNCYLNNSFYENKRVDNLTPEEIGFLSDIIFKKKV